MRITDNMLLANYNTNLQRNISNLAASNMRLASERSFNHVSEDTSSAARAFVIRDQLARTEEHIRTIDNASGELTSAEGNIMVIQSIATSAYETATSAGGPKEQKDFEILAEQINGQKNEMLQTMNATYANKYLFSGSGSEAPFSVSADGKLLFNGTPVDTATSAGDFKNNEDVYLDIGFGINGQTGTGAKTGIKISTSGVDVLGYGTDGDGNPNNVYSLMDKLENQLRAGDKDGAIATAELLKDKASSISNSITEIGTREKLLERTKDRLETNQINLKESQQSLEGVKLEQEATENKNYEMAWMVTLQLGSNIIPASIFDFMK
ncbi:FgL, flagellar protein [[Clostridium] symbiosum]|uniref:flagellin N-terminal helical domain-containing protein n=1 Tax=Clostridium symbiosum TaxID=1512 RepID=UPI001D082A77|nr:FgL, flagellar protein [[Clostridium] symbiosum]MCB6609802.1 FgL, flagellar protein [[Clostridium] symbiosum]MCB6931242.1 FgL, flagellar protein [[Clostridium] symbiosum]